MRPVEAVLPGLKKCWKIWWHPSQPWIWVAMKAPKTPFRESFGKLQTTIISMLYSCFISHHSLREFFFFFCVIFFSGRWKKEAFLCVFLGWLYCEWWTSSSTCWWMVENNKVIQVSIDLVFFFQLKLNMYRRHYVFDPGPPTQQWNSCRLFFCGICKAKQCHVVLVRTVTIWGVYLGSTLHPVTVTTRIIPLLVGNPYKPSFTTVTGWEVDPRYI